MPPDFKFTASPVLQEAIAMSLSFVGAHPAGFCDVAYIENGEDVHLVTVGKDGKLAFRSADKPGEVVKSVDAHGEGEEACPLTGVATSPEGTAVAVSDEQNFVKIFKFPEGDLATIATRFTLPARCLAYSASGVNMAAAGDDEGIKLIDLAGNKVFRTLRSEAYTRGLAYDPEGEYLAAAGADGTLTVWNMGTGKAEITKKRACPRVDPLAPARLRPAWHPDGGAVLAAPAADGSIAFYERLSWEPAGELEGQHASPPSLLAFSKNGLYLASAAGDQSLVVWDVVARKAIEKKVLPGAACGLAWHPAKNALAVVTEDGEVGVWSSPVPANLPGPAADVDALTGVKKSQEAGAGAAGRLIDDAAAEDSDDGSDGEGSDAPDSFIADSPGRKHRRRSGRALFGAVAADDLPQPQAAIQSGATALVAGRRYLAYNALGSITLRSESDHNTVEVAFHDTVRARRRVPLLTDFFGFTLGALGEAGALYASPASPDAPSTVVYRPFESWAPNAEWSLGLPAGEEAVALAAGASFAAVATDKRQLRLMSAAGLQTAVIALPGAPVALAAAGGRLAVGAHAGAPTPAGDQTIELMEYDVGERRLVRRLPLALSPGASLAWLGYTEEGAVGVYDSEGVLRVLSPEFGGAWIPVFSAAAERRGGEHFWVFAASLRRGEVQCIVCADGPEPLVPSGSARPVVTAAPVRVPVVAADEAQAPLEAEMLRQGVAAAHAGAAAADAAGDAEAVAAYEGEAAAAQVDADRAALRLFTRLVQGDRQGRALEVALTMSAPRALEGAVKIAHHHRASKLAEAVEDLLAQRLEAEAAAVEAEAMGAYGAEYGAIGGVPAAPVVPAASPAGGLGLRPAGGSARKAAAAPAEAAPAEAAPVENGSPNGKVAKAVEASGSGAKRKAPVGNPFARKKGAAATKA